MLTDINETGVDSLPGTRHFLLRLFPSQIKVKPVHTPVILDLASILIIVINIAETTKGTIEEDAEDAKDAEARRVAARRTWAL
jgi:hypothetical protein